MVLAAANTRTLVDTVSGKQIFQLKGFEKDWGYAQAVGAGGLIFVSGTVSIDHEGRPHAENNMAEQVRSVYADIAASLAGFGATMSHIVRESLLTTDLPRFIAEGAPVRAQAYQGHSLPASAPWIEVPRLAQSEFLFEVEVIAVHPGQPRLPP